MCVTILRTLGVMYETKYQNFGMQFATNLPNAPLLTPFLGTSEKAAGRYRKPQMGICPLGLCRSSTALPYATSFPHLTHESEQGSCALKDDHLPKYTILPNIYAVIWQVLENPTPSGHSLYMHLFVPRNQLAKLLQLLLQIQNWGQSKCVCVCQDAFNHNTGQTAAISGNFLH